MGANKKQWEPSLISKEPEMKPMSHEKTKSKAKNKKIAFQKPMANNEHTL